MWQERHLHQNLLFHASIVEDAPEDTTNSSAHPVASSVDFVRTPSIRWTHMNTASPAWVWPTLRLHSLSPTARSALTCWHVFEDSKERCSWPYGDEAHFCQRATDGPSPSLPQFLSLMRAFALRKTKTQMSILGSDKPNFGCHR